MKNSIFFRVDGDFNNKYGSGHILRCLKIYQQIKKSYKNKFNFFFITKKNFGSNFLKAKTGERIIDYSKNFNKFLIKREDIVIIDTLGADIRFLNFLKKIKVSKIVSFDETNIKNFEKGIIINGIYFTKKNLISCSKQIKIFQGLKYILLDKSFSLKRKKINFKNKIAIVCAGGNDKKNFAYHIIKKIKEIKNLKIRVIIGKGVSKSNPVFKFRNYKGIKFIKDKTNIYKYFISSNLAFVTGGTLMFEAICLGFKPYVSRSYDNQKYAINYFKKRRLINYLGKTDNLKLKNLKSELNKFNPKKLRFKKNNLIDGKGFFRVFKIIQKTFLN